MRDATLILPLKGEFILLGRKKRGFGKDKINGFGGKVKEESIIRAALRELKEESGLICKEEQLIKHAELEFFFPENKAKEWNQKVHVFIITSWEGEPKESEEMTCEKHPLDKLPYEQMWDDDKHWMPYVLEKKKIKAKFYFKEDCNTIDMHNIVEVEGFD